MTKKIKQLLNLSETWLLDRKLEASQQRKGYLINVYKELGELADAITDKDTHQVIDAYCDIFVFTLTSFGDNQIQFIEDDVVFDKKELHSELLINIAFYAQDGFRFQILTRLYRILTELCNELGYNFYQCMLETFLEIDSRTGAYDEQQGKWIKDESPEAKAKWYQANYKKCKNG